MVVRFRDDLFETYTHIREKYQTQIDETFDRISREIGFVVTTAVPYTFEVKDKRVKEVAITEELQNTIFDHKLTPVIKPLYDDPVPLWNEVGIHKLYVFWYGALKLKLGTDWVEPAHFREVIWDVREPAHWFDPGIAIDQEEAVLISVIDEVYPELRLVDRVSYYRQGLGRMGQTIGAFEPQTGLTPGMAGPNPEPAAVGSGPQPAQPPAQMFTELATLLRRYGY